MKKKANKKNEERVMNKRMLERLIFIHNEIKAGMYPTCEKLRKLYTERTGLTVGVATIYRDISALRTNFKAPLEYDHEKLGYFYMDDNWEFSVNQITANDIFYLSCAKNLLSNFNGSPVYNQIANVIDFVTQAKIGNKNEIMNRVAMPPLPKACIKKDIWQPIIDSLRQNTLLQFDYNGRWNKTTTHRLVRPYQLLFQDGMYFLFGFDEKADKGKGAERLFNLSRIKKIKSLEETFELPKDYDFASRCGGGRFGAFKDAKKNLYEIEFYGDSREYIKNCIWADDQKISDSDKDDTTTIIFSSSQSAKVLEWVLSQGGNARPLSPECLVSEWKEHIKWMMQNAGIKSKPSNPTGKS